MDRILDKGDLRAGRAWLDNNIEFNWAFMYNDIVKGGNWKAPKVYLNFEQFLINFPNYTAYDHPHDDHRSYWTGLHEKGRANC